MDNYLYPHFGMNIKRRALFRGITLVVLLVAAISILYGVWGPTLTPAVPDDLTAVFDLRWTAEAVGNILDNAVKYSPDRCEITISACAYDMFVRIDIADNGCGIAEDELCNIWKRFYRGKNAENEKGVGIGLYLTANILNTEGGRVSAKSDENGSTFTVFLPKT